MRSPTPTPADQEPERSPSCRPATQLHLPTSFGNEDDLISISLPPLSRAVHALFRKSHTRVQAGPPSTCRAPVRDKARFCHAFNPPLTQSSDNAAWSGIKAGLRSALNTPPNGVAGLRFDRSRSRATMAKADTSRANQSGQIQKLTTSSCHSVSCHSIVLSRNRPVTRCVT